MRKNLLFFVSLLAAVATLAVLAWVGAGRWGEIGPAAERAWRERAAAFLESARGPAAEDWVRTEDLLLQAARKELARRQAGVPEDPLAPPRAGTRWWFALDAEGSLIHPESEGDPWSPVAEIAPADAEGRARLEEGERKEFQERNPEAALALYASAASPEHGVTLRSEARLAAGAAAFRLGRFAEAAEFYRMIRDDPAPSGIPPWIRAAALHRMALALERAGDRERAARALEELLSRLVRRGRKAPLAGLERGIRAFLVESALADLARAAGRPDAAEPFRRAWWVFLDDGHILNAVRESVVPALRRDPASPGRRIRLPAAVGQHSSLAVVEGDGMTALGIFEAPLPSLGEGPAAPETGPFAARLEMPGRAASGPGVLASAPLFPGSQAPVLCVSAREPDAILREASRQKALLAALLALSGAGLLAGTFLVLRRLKKEMDLSRLKTDFLANLSHDLRTPLSIIRSAAETLHLGRVKDPEKTQRYLEIVLKEAGRIEGMIGNVMDAARLELGRRALHFAPVAPRDLLGDVERARRLLLEEAGFTLEVAVEEDAPAILGDREALAHALLNLVENAVKYSPDRKEIRLSARGRGGEAVLSVEDRGMGIAPEERARLFERFHRSGPALREAGGVGLGLFLVAGIVRAHGGRIEVEAREGGGTAFSMAFPAAPAGKDGAAREDPAEG